MISALAVGYGVGMATPDSTITSVRTAVAAYRPGSPHAAPAVGLNPAHAWAGRGPTGAAVPPMGYAQAYPQPYPPAYLLPPGYPGAAAGYPAQVAPGQAQLTGGLETPELSRLRSLADHSGRSCPLHRPRYSVPPSYASEPDATLEDVDDLDPAGQEALTRLQLPDFRCAVSRRAIKYVRFLTRSDRGRGLFESWLKRGGRYQEMVQQQLREWGMPEDLIWVAMIESGFDPRAKSPAGAVGMWQFMRSTGGVYGLTVDRYVDERMNPYRATQAAAHHLRDLHQRFGDWELALAAYNMGYEQLLMAIDLYGTTDFSELARQKAIPSETAAYVPKIVAAALVANNLERYGFGDVKPYAPLHVAELSVPGGTKLATIAKAAGISKSTLRRHNPQFLTGHVPPDRREYTVRVPSDTISRARAALPAMLDRRVALTDGDVLDPVDLLGGGAKAKQRTGGGWEQEQNLLQLLPKPKRRSLRTMLGRDKAEPAARDEALAALADEFTHRRSDRETVMYRVGSGDTLIGVARQFAVDIEDLARDNGMDVDAKLREGALLKVMVKRAVLDRWQRGGSKPSQGGAAEDDGAEPGSAQGGQKKSAKKGKGDEPA